MKDGTVEYVPVYNAYKTSNYNSRGKISGVTDIVYIGNVSANGYCEPIAMKSDGSFYILSDILKGTGNYNFQLIIYDNSLFIRTCLYFKRDLFFMLTCFKNVVFCKKGFKN